MFLLGLVLGAPWYGLLIGACLSHMDMKDRESVKSGIGTLLFLTWPLFAIALSELL